MKYPFKPPLCIEEAFNVGEPYIVADASGQGRLSVLSEQSGMEPSEFRQMLRDNPDAVTDKKAWQLAAMIVALPDVIEAAEAALRSMKDAVSDDPHPDWRDSLADAIDCVEAALQKAKGKTA